jgi:diguanylate cyclase (GGDEF)-like protein
MRGRCPDPHGRRPTDPVASSASTQALEAASPLLARGPTREVNVDREDNRNVLVNGNPPPPEEGPGPSDQRQSDADQTLADNDQTLSDQDQTLSDLDQAASDDDQAASDWDRDHGGDSASHRRTTAIRAATSSRRVEIASLRDETAEQRDRAAEERDQAAARRDQLAVDADEEALALDGRDAISDRHTLRVQELRGRAAEARKRAASDRRRAAQEREHATRDREQAARDREDAARDRELAGADELTGARRRGVGLDEIQREIDRARRTEEGLVAAYVDVDNLKAVNDNISHLAGDELLREVVDRLRHHMRSYDLIVRVGGDEFVCALPGVTLMEARRRFDEVCSELHEGPAVGSISFGISELRDGESPEELIHRADLELQAARGR